MKFESYKGVSFIAGNNGWVTFFYTQLDAEKNGEFICEKWAKPWNAKKRAAELEAAGYTVRTDKSRASYHMIGNWMRYPACKDEDPTDI